MADEGKGRSGERRRRSRRRGNGRGDKPGAGRSGGNGGSAGSGGNGGSSGNGGGGGRRRGGQRSSRRAAAFKKKIDERLFGKRDAGRGRMIERLRQAQGTDSFSRLYREFVKGHGLPEDVPTLMILLDVDEEREALKVVGALEDAVNDAPSEQKTLLKSRLKNLEMSSASDAVADAAAELLERL